MGEKMDPLGVAALLLAAFMWAVGSLYGRNAPLPRSPLWVPVWKCWRRRNAAAFGDDYREWSQVELAAISTRSWLGLIYLIVFGALIGFAAYTWLLRVAPTPLVSTYAYVNPLIAIFLGACWRTRSDPAHRDLCARDCQLGGPDQYLQRIGYPTKKKQTPVVNSTRVD